MQDKEKLSMYVDIIKITIIICWVSLIAFWLLKIFGGNLFEIMVENENFLKFSELVQNSWVKYLVSFINTLVAKFLTFGAICQSYKFEKKQFLFFTLSSVSIWAVANFVPLDFLMFPSWYGYIYYILFAVIYQNGYKKLYGVLGILLENIFTIISFSIRNLPIEITQNYLLLLILVIDFYIMLFLYFLYANLIKIKKEI